MPRFGTYANCTTVHGLFSAHPCLETPPFQRDYVWKKPHWEDLWHDILQICRANKASSEDLHFLGVVTLIPRHDGAATLIVDGQQRLTTLSILLCAIRDSLDKTTDDNAYREFHRSLWNSDTNHPRLSPRYRNSLPYRDVVRQQSPSDPRNPLLQAYRFFLKRVNESDLSAIEIGRSALHHLQIVWVVLDHHDALTRVFEDLNAKRVALRQCDLIRSHVFDREDAESQDKFDRDHWQAVEDGFQRGRGQKLDAALFDDFFHHLLMCDGRTNVSRTQVYRQFRNLEIVRNADTAPGRGSTITDWLRPRKDRYLEIRGRRTPDDPVLRDALDRLRRPHVSVVFPVALAILDAEAAGRLTAVERNLTLDMLSSYLIRGHICGRDSREQWRILPRLCHLGDERQSVVTWLRDRLVEKKWPDDTEFKRRFVTHGAGVGPFQGAVVRGLERARQVAAGYRVQDEPPSVQIEHVLPKSIADSSNKNSRAWQETLGVTWKQLHESWVNAPGNLALLSGKSNVSLGNKPYDEKKPLLIEAKTYLNEDFKRYDSWGPREIEDRGTALAEEAVHIWKGPDHSDWA